MIKPLVQDNIVALATPPGIGAIAVIRISGQNLKPLYKKITQSKSAPIPRYANYTKIYDSNNNPIDNCLITYFPNPHSFTGEDVIEISSHGGGFIPKAILGMLYGEKVRQAGPGEFSYRAFLNGKIDLVQAESISGIISAKTTKNAKVQLGNLDGMLSDLIVKLKNESIYLLTVLEHELDFTEDEINFTKKDDINSAITSLKSNIENILESSSFGDKINTGVRVVLCGKPNAGKSSLFNRLSGSNRAIVTNIAGTTRDTIEAWIEISGIPVCIIDTAGIIDSKNKVESIGVEKSNNEIANSDIIMVLDEENPVGFYEQNNLGKLKKDSILIHTKSDLKPSSVYSQKIVEISVKHDTGINNLYTKLSTLLKKNISYNYIADPVVMSCRQKQLLIAANQLLIEAINSLKTSFDAVILSSLLRGFTEVLEEILGKITNEDIFDNLFSSFCVGK